MEITRRVISGEREGDNGGKGTGNKKHNWQAQHRQGELRIVQKMEKSKKLYVQPMDMNWGGGWVMLVGGEVQGEG